MDRRISLIARGHVRPDRDWNEAGTAERRLMFAESPSTLAFALRAWSGSTIEVERVIIDGTGTEADFLDFLTRLPVDFSGDVLFIRRNEEAYLSATGRGGDRVLYALKPGDVRFYLETHELVTGRVAIRLAS